MKRLLRIKLRWNADIYLFVQEQILACNLLSMEVALSGLQDREVRVRVR